jgi:hypothetical protein
MLQLAYVKAVLANCLTFSVALSVQQVVQLAFSNDVCKLVPCPLNLIGLVQLSVRKAPVGWHCKKKCRSGGIYAEKA